LVAAAVAGASSLKWVELLALAEIAMKVEED